MIGNSEIISLLKSFSSEEIERLKLYVSSVYCVPNERHRSLFSEILSHHPEYKIEKEKLFLGLNLMEKYEDSTARNFISAFGKAVLDFLAHEKLTEDETRKKIYVLESASERTNIRYVSKLLKEFSDELSLNSEIDEQRFLARFELGLLRFNKLYSEDTLFKHGVGELLGILDDAIASIFTYFFSVVNDAYLDMLSFSRNVKFEKEKTLAYKLMNALRRSVEEIIPDSFVQHHRYIEIQKGFIEVFGDLKSKEKYEKLKSLVTETEKELSLDEASHFYSQLASCCLMKNHDGQDYNNERMNIYKVIVEKKYFPRNTGYKLSPELFRNILLHGMKMEELEWITGFITDSKKYLSPHLSKDLYNFGKSQLHFEMGAYSKCIWYAEKINFTYFIFSYDLNNILLKAYCETGLCEKALSLIDCYRHLLYRDKMLIEDRKKRYRKFINYTEKILKNSDDKDELGYFKSKIHKDEMTASKEWLERWILSLIEGKRLTG